MNMKMSEAGMSPTIDADGAPSLVTSGTGDGLIAFLEYVQERGYMTAATASALRTGCTKVLESVPELRAVDLRSIDMAQRMLQFRNKSKGKYADRTVEAYRKRFEQSVSMYGKWLVDDKDWLSVRVRRRTARIQTNSPSPGTPTDAPGLPPSADTAGQHQSSMVTYPLPLRPGVKATLILPEDLTESEAARVSQFVKALVFEHPTPSTRSEPE